MTAQQGTPDGRPQQTASRARAGAVLPWLSILVLALGSAGCGTMNQLVSRAASGYLADGALVFQREPDPRLAEEAIPANFKLLEILLYRTPDDRRLLALASEYVATYAYGFVEPRAEMLEVSDPDRAAETRRRASALYLRGRDYGLRALANRKVFQRGLTGSPEQLEAGLKTLKPADLPALFWTAFCWGSYVNLNLERPEALADSGLVTAMMARALELDETYYYGGAHLFFGALQSRLPPGAGGDPTSSRAHFEKAMAISHGRLLMTKVFFARYYAVRVQDRALFNATLEEVLQADATQWPDERLANTLAQERARFYLEQRDEYFLDPGTSSAGASVVDEPQDH